MTCHGASDLGLDAAIDFRTLLLFTVAIGISSMSDESDESDEDAEKRDDKMLAFILDERELARALFITRYYLVEHGMTRRRYDDA
jgi:hypothetical protein